MIERIVEGLYKISVPLPNNDLEYVNTYLVRGQRDLLIDTGFDMDICEKTLLKAFDELRVDKKNLDICITHLHPDHAGLLNRLTSKDMRVWCNKGKNALKEKEEKLQEWIEIKNLFNSYVNLYSIQKDKIESQFYIHPELMTNGEDFENLSLLRQGDVLTVGDFQLHCIETPGHHYTHICLYEPHKKILFSGDHVLLDISPNITSFSIRSNPLDEYLESLDKIKSLDVDLVLPGHGSPFYELNNRIEELNIHHQRRLEEILNIIAQGHHNVFEICKHVKWNGPNGSWDKMPLLLKGFAVGETMAHLIYLLNMKKVSVDYSQNGILHFQLEC